MSMDGDQVKSSVMDSQPDLDRFAEQVTAKVSATVSTHIAAIVEQGVSRVASSVASSVGHVRELLELRCQVLEDGQQRLARDFHAHRAEQQKAQQEQQAIMAKLATKSELTKANLDSDRKHRRTEKIVWGAVVSCAASISYIATRVFK